MTCLTLFEPGLTVTTPPFKATTSGLSADGAGVPPPPPPPPPPAAKPTRGIKASNQYGLNSYDAEVNGSPPKACATLT